MMKHWKLTVIAFAAVALIFCGAAVANGIAGSEEDPLVTLGYLNQVFAPAMAEEVDKAVAENEAALKAELDGAIKEWSEKVEQQAGQSGSDSDATFQVVTLSKGQTLTGKVGCEVMLRVGTASCVSGGNPGLIDSTDGSTLANGSALKTNHLYMITIDTRGVTATADTVKVLARGEYTVA